MRDLPQEVLPYYGLPVVALVLGLYRCRHETGERRWGWIGATAVMAITTLLALWQVRGSAAANALALAMAAAALVRGLPAPEGGAIFFGLGRAAADRRAAGQPARLDRRRQGAGLDRRPRSPARNGRS